MRIHSLRTYSLPRAQISVLDWVQYTIHIFSAIILSDEHPFGERLLVKEYMVFFLRNLDARVPGKENSSPHGARPVHLIITMIKWIRTSRLSIKNSVSVILSREVSPRSLLLRGGGRASFVDPGFDCMQLGPLSLSHSLRCRRIDETRCQFLECCLVPIRQLLESSKSVR